jgi:hypothetical protein
VPAIIPFIPLIVGGVSAGASAYSAHKQSEANQHAADTQATASEKGTEAQSKAAEQALEFQKQQYRNTQIATAPYQNMGAGALAALGSGLGVTPGNIAPTPIALDRPVGQTTSGFLSPDDFTAFKNQVMNGPTNAFAQPNQQVNTWMNPQPQANSTQSLSQSSVRLQSPDGKDVQDVPASQAQYFISKGAKVVQ